MGLSASAHSPTIGRVNNCTRVAVASERLGDFFAEDREGIGQIGAAAAPGVEGARDAGRAHRRHALALAVSSQGIAHQRANAASTVPVRVFADLDHIDKLLSKLIGDVRGGSLDGRQVIDRIRRSQRPSTTCSRSGSPQTGRST
jgi:hypothetical protein